MNLIFLCIALCITGLLFSAYYNGIEYIQEVAFEVVEAMIMVLGVSIMVFISEPTLETLIYMMFGLTFLCSLFTIIVKLFRWCWLEMKKDRYLMKYLIFSCIALGIAALLFSIYDSDIEYTRIVRGKYNFKKSGYYSEYVLVKNVPKNDFEQNKAMIAYFDSVGPSINYISKMLGIEHYYMSFYESTYASRRYLIEAGKYWAEKKDIPAEIIKEFENTEYHKRETCYLGYVHMYRCDVNDPAKWNIEFDKTIGVSENYDIESELTVLHTDCDYYPPRAWLKENEELVNYYKGLREKK